MEFIEHIKWLNENKVMPFKRRRICQCETEKMIMRSNEPSRIRAEFLSYVFLDQFIYTHYQVQHSLFKRNFHGPSLKHHIGTGFASPCWLIYPSHLENNKRFLNTLMSTFYEYMNGGNKWLKAQTDFQDSQYWSYIKFEIRQVFSEFYQEKLLAIIEKQTG